MMVIDGVIAVDAVPVNDSHRTATAPVSDPCGCATTRVPVMVPPDSPVAVIVVVPTAVAESVGIDPTTVIASPVVGALLNDVSVAVIGVVVTASAPVAVGEFPSVNVHDDPDVGRHDSAMNHHDENAPVPVGVTVGAASPDTIVRS